MSRDRYQHIARHEKEIPCEKENEHKKEGSQEKITLLSKKRIIKEKLIPSISL
jgi:hypothetical protein